MILRTRVTVALLLALVLLGGWAYVVIPKEDSPDVPIPLMYVGVTLPGISPEDAVNLLVKPLEVELRSLKGLDELEATAYEGGANLMVKFTAGFDPDAALADVRAKVDLARSKLPNEADEPLVEEVNISLFPVLTIVLNGAIPERGMRTLAEDLQEKLEAVPGVLEVPINGVREEMLLLEVDRTALETYNIPLATLLRVVTDNNRLINSGSLQVAEARYAVRIPSLFRTPDDVLELPLKTQGEAVVRVRDVADVRPTFKDPVTLARVDGQPAVTLDIKKRIGANILNVVDTVKTVVATEAASWPAQVGYRFLNDTSRDIRTMLNDLQNSVILALLLVLLVIVLAMDWRGAALVGMTVPASFLVAILLLYMLGFTTNVVVLFALILSVGILVDGSIVVAEYAQQLQRKGVRAREAYVQAAYAMAWPVGTGTLVTLLVFMPLLGWPDTVGEFMKFMPITLFFTLLASWVLAMVFLPSVGGMLPEPKQGRQESLGDKWFDGVAGRYLKAVEFVLRKPTMWLLASFLFLLLVVSLYVRLGPGVEFFPEIEPDRAQLEVRATGDLGLVGMDAILREVERRMGALPGVLTTRVLVGKSSFDQAEEVIGTIVLEYVPWSPERPKSTEILAEAQRRVGHFPGVTVTTAVERAGPQQGKPVQVTLLGDNFATLRILGQRLAAEMEQQEGFLNVETNLPLPGVQWEFQVDKVEAARRGTNIAEVGQVLSLATDGAIIGTWRPADREEEIDIVARFAAGERTLETLAGARVPGEGGAVAISDVATQVAVPRVTQIQRLDQRTQVTVSADVAEGFLADTLVQGLQNELAQRALPPGIEVRFRGDTEAQDDSQSFLLLAFVVGVLMIGLVMLIQFNSVGQVLIVLSTIVLSTIGVMLGHLILHKPFGVVMSGLGIIALAGIVVNNNIVLLDTYNTLKREGLAWRDALLETCRQRLRPVLLTAVTTGVGIMPLAFRLNVDFVNRAVTYNAPSTQWWDQLASAILFGLTFSTILTLLLTPCMIAVLERWQARHPRPVAA